MTTPEQPKNPPPPETKPALPDHAPNGVPPDAAEAEATGLPTSDRHETETAAKPD